MRVTDEKGVQVQDTPQKDGNIIYELRFGEIVDVLETSDCWIRHIHGWSKVFDVEKDKVNFESALPWSTHATLILTSCCYAQNLKKGTNLGFTKILKEMIDLQPRTIILYKAWILRSLDDVAFWKVK